MLLEVVKFFLSIENYCVYKSLNYPVENNKVNLICTKNSTSGAKNPFSLINSLLNWVKSSIGWLLGSRGALSKETSSPPSPISQVDAQVNGKIMLLDMLVRKVKGQKHISTVGQSTSLLEEQGYALNIAKRFEEVVEQAVRDSKISIHRLNIDSIEIQKEITKKIIGGKFNEISGILKSYIEKACPAREAGCPGKLSSKKFDKFMTEFNKGLDLIVNQSMQQILHNGDGTANGTEEQQMSLKPQSYLSNTSTQGHLTQARDLRLN